VVVPQSKPFRSGKMSHSERDSSPQVSSDRSGNMPGNISWNPGESAALSSLKELIAAGDNRLDPMLGTIADAARRLTGASGAALAMWKEGAMVCRARSGETAPALGAQLSANRGISGECLRTGKIQHCTDTENDPLVDVEVCRSLGLRSMAVLPIQGWRGINGILEVFSTQPAAFTGPHIALLEQLAALAERARATQPYDASPAAPKPPSAMEKARPSGLLPASDRVGDVVLAFIGFGSGSRSRALVLGAIGLVAISLLALVIWLGWSGADEADKSHAGMPASVDVASANTVTARRLDQHPSDSDQVWGANPGGEKLFSSRGKPSAGAPVKFAAKVDVLGSKKTPAGRSPLLADFAGKVVGDASIAPNSQTGSPTDLHTDSQRIESQPSEARPTDLRSNDLGSSDSHSGEAVSAELPSMPASLTNPSSLNTVLSAKASLPGLSAPVSTGVSGGQLVYRVAPVYPVQARQLRQQGTVILTAMLKEDGTVSDIKVVEGPPVFVPSAVEAVKHWRYKPYELDGKPVKNEIRIAVDFKFPESNH
jgi:TonB family protein